MSREPKFYVKREECWGGTYVWFVMDRETRKYATSQYHSERAALSRRDKMEADYERYAGAMIASHK